MHVEQNTSSADFVMILYRNVYFQSHAVLCCGVVRTNLQAGSTQNSPGPSGEGHEVAEVINQGEHQVAHGVCILKGHESFPFLIAC